LPAALLLGRPKNNVAHSLSSKLRSLVGLQAQATIVP
jgi:hypothetical protein